MSMQSLMAALEQKDFRSLAACFSESGQIDDYCPGRLGKNNFHVYGSRTVEMFYRNQFALGGLAISNVKIQDDRSASFLISYRNYTVYAGAKISALDSEGKIRRLTINPA